MTKVLKLENIGTFIFLSLNLLLFLTIFTNGFNDMNMFVLICIIYILIIVVSLSPLGELLMCFLVGAKEIRRYDYKLKIVPLIEIVVDKASRKGIKLPSKLKLKIIYNNNSPMVYALGRKTICITESLLNIDDHVILGMLAHEIGHLAYKHTTLHVLIGGSNVLFSGSFLIIKLFINVIKYILSLGEHEEYNSPIRIIYKVINIIVSTIVFLWTRFCMFFLRLSISRNEYAADTFAFEIGLGKELAIALDSLHPSEMNKIGILKALYVEKPNHNDRIARLQMLGVNYNRYQGE